MAHFIAPSYRRADILGLIFSLVILLYHLCVCAIFDLIVCKGGVEGIQLLQVSVPSVIQAGEGAALLCDVDMENERLYSVKWYRGDEVESVEFFRFVPRETPQLIVYNLPGINVNVSLYSLTFFIFQLFSK